MTFLGVVWAKDAAVSREAGLGWLLGGGVERPVHRDVGGHGKTGVV